MKKKKGGGGVKLPSLWQTVEYTAIYLREKMWVLLILR